MFDEDVKKKKSDGILAVDTDLLLLYSYTSSYP